MLPQEGQLRSGAARQTAESRAWGQVVVMQPGRRHRWKGLRPFQDFGFYCEMGSHWRVLSNDSSDLGFITLKGVLCYSGQVKTSY